MHKPFLPNTSKISFYNHTWCFREETKGSLIPVKRGIPVRVLITFFKKKYPLKK